MTRSGSGCSLSPCWLGASAVTTLMMVPAVCALAMLADLHRAAWLAAAA